jgi:hypothetical protein
LGTIGFINIVAGWSGMVIGISSGAFLGMYAFNGPFRPLKGHEAYDALPRRMLRLAHIAWVMLPLINIVYGNHIDAANLSDEMKLFGSWAQIVGMIGVPTFLTLSALVWHPFKYFEAIPVSATLISLCIIAYGYIRLL